MIVLGTELETDDATCAETIQKAVAVTDLNVYAVKYNMTGLPFPFIELRVKDGKLMMNAGGQTGEIKPMSEEDKFDADGKPPSCLSGMKRKR